MALTSTQRSRIVRQYIRTVFLEPNATANLNVSDLQAAADDLESFIVSNSTAVNNALPEPFKGTATLAQKRLLLALVACEIAGLLDLGGD